MVQPERASDRLHTPGYQRDLGYCRQVTQMVRLSAHTWALCFELSSNWLTKLATVQFYRTLIARLKVASCPGEYCGRGRATRMDTSFGLFGRRWSGACTFNCAWADSRLKSKRTRTSRSFHLHLVPHRSLYEHHMSFL